ncbi:MAG: hypothetical protein AW09_002765 [Candidatus Accumulibacter phosphatis]|uniref:Uncharacterized protein n=1 Tax=Candidatus Accumulibacter phosphatis TaxID=327160 RepID=A0A080LU40_9PROT|nr:MAG: hypothetical protein AW09_002765 [Candidatus Accumulibacter phosphatis]
MRFGQVQECRADLDDQLQDRLAILAAGKHPVQCQQVARQRFLVGFQHANQLRCQAIELVGQDHHADQHLLGTLGIRFDLQPQACEVENQIVTTRVASHLDRSRQDSRVAGAHGQVGIGLAGELGFASLQRHFGEQQLIDHLSAEFLVVLVVEAWREGLRRIALELMRSRFAFPGGGVAGSQSGHAEGQRQRRAEESVLDRFHGFLACREPLQEPTATLRHNLRMLWTFRGSSNARTPGS